MGRTLYSRPLCRPATVETPFLSGPLRLQLFPLEVEPPDGEVHCTWQGNLCSFCQEACIRVVVSVVPVLSRHLRAVCVDLGAVLIIQAVFGRSEKISDGRLCVIGNGGPLCSGLDPENIEEVLGNSPELWP